MTQTNKFQSLDLARQFHPIQRMPIIASHSMEISLTQKWMVLMESLKFTRMLSTMWTCMDQRTSHQFWDSSMKWLRTSSARSKTRSTLFFWSSPMELLVICKKLLMRLFTDLSFHCRSSLWVLAVQTSAQWTSWMQMKYHSIQIDTGSKCPPISFNSCHLGNLHTFQCSLQRRPWRKFQDRCLATSGRKASNQTQRQRLRSAPCSKSSQMLGPMADRIQSTRVTISQRKRSNSWWRCNNRDTTSSPCKTSLTTKAWRRWTTTSFAITWTTLTT